jgi:hypothetical protein
VGPVELLRQLADDGSAGGVGQQSELAQVLARGVAVRPPFERGADENGALLLRREGDQIPGDELDSVSRGE